MLHHGPPMSLGATTRQQRRRSPAPVASAAGRPLPRAAPRPRCVPLPRDSRARPRTCSALTRPERPRPRWTQTLQARGGELKSAGAVEAVRSRPLAAGSTAACPLTTRTQRNAPCVARELCCILMRRLRVHGAMLQSASAQGVLMLCDGNTSSVDPARARGGRGVARQRYVRVHRQTGMRKRGAAPLLPRRGDPCR